MNPKINIKTPWLNITHYPEFQIIQTCIYNQTDNHLSHLIKSLSITKMASYLKQDVNFCAISIYPNSMLPTHVKENKLKG